MINTNDLSNSATAPIILQMRLERAKVDNQMITDFVNLLNKNKIKYALNLGYYKNSYSVDTGYDANISSIHNVIKNDYPGYIVDTIRGYFLGKPISYTCENKIFMEKIQDILDRNDESYHNISIAQDMGIYGEAFEVLYLDEDGMPAFHKGAMGEWLVIYDMSIKPKIQLAVRFYEIYDVTNGNKIYYVDLYWDDMIVHFQSTSGGSYLRDTSVYPDGEEVHPWGMVPVVHHLNNEYRLGDFDKVLSEIDNYAKMNSFNADELEQFRQAYMVISGNVIDQEEAEKFKKIGIITLGEGGQAAFLTKSVNDAFVTNHLNRINNDIHKFAKVPDMMDENFAGNLSGIAIKFKYKTLEEMCAIKEALMKKALYRRLQLMANIFNLSLNKFNPRDVYIIFNRNLPVNATEELNDALLKQTLGIPMEDILSGLSFIEDPQDVLERMMPEVNPNDEDGVV